MMENNEKYLIGNFVNMISNCNFLCVFINTESQNFQVVYLPLLYSTQIFDYFAVYLTKGEHFELQKPSI
jgi:hypothetical protein